MMQFFKRKNKAWDGGEKDAELKQQDEALSRELSQLAGRKPAATPSRPGRSMQALRQKASRDCLDALDQTIASLTLSSLTLPPPQVLEPYGRIEFKWVDRPKAQPQTQIRLHLKPGLLVDRAAVLAYDQSLWSAYTHPSSLAILLLPEEGEPLIAHGPQVDNEDLVWQLPAAQLSATGKRYQPRIDAFVAEEDKVAFRYAVGQAASAEGTDAALDTQSQPQSPYQVTCFSAQAESAQVLVIGLEGQALPGVPFEFAPFKDYLLTALDQARIPYTPDAEFPSSGRIYLQIEPARKTEVDACLAQLNSGADGQPQ